MRRHLTIPFATLLAVLSWSSVAAAEESPLTVQIITVHPVADVHNFSLTGEVAARDTLPASFPASGRISEMLVVRGDKVVAGAVLARMDSVLQEQALRSAEAAVITAVASADKAAADSERQNSLFEQGASTRSARDAAADALQAAQSTAAQARADLDRASKALSDTVLTAQTAGTVTDELAHVGQVVGAAQSVLELAFGDQYDAVFQVPEILLTTSRAEPISVRLSPLDHSGTVVTGKPRLISPLVDPVQGTVKVKVAMQRLPARMRFGDAIVGTLTEKDQSRVTVPWSVLSVTAMGPAVWVIDPRTHAVSLRQITVLRYETDNIVLSDGLKDGEKIVGLGSNLLYPGRVVRAAEDQ